MVTVGDVGYLHGDGYPYLTGRAAFMIISGPGPGPSPEPGPPPPRSGGHGRAALGPAARQPGPWHLTC